MAAAPQRSESYKAQREVEDLHLVLRARSGNRASEAEIIRRYASFVRLRSSSYFIAGGDPDNTPLLHQQFGGGEAGIDFHARLFRLLAQPTHHIAERHDVVAFIMHLRWRQ